MKKVKVSLLKKIMFILTAILLVTMTVTDVLRYVAFYQESCRHSEEATRQASTQLGYLLTKDDVDACVSDPNGEKAREIKNKLCKICIENDIRYIYVFEPDFKADTIKYCFAVSGDSELNKELEVDRPAGTVVKPMDNILEASENAWSNNGERTTRYENEYGDVTASFSTLKDDGEAYALVGVECNPIGVTEYSVRNLIIKMIGSLLIFVTLFVIIAMLVRRRIIKPILHISERMSKFTTDIEERDFNPIEVHTGDEIERVADSFNKMAGEINSYINKVTDFVAQEARVSTEFEVAKKIQYGIVAERMDSKLSEKFYFSGRMRSAREVGGDFYDSFTLSDGRHCVLIGDVSEKGIGAAMFMMQVKAILHEKLMTCSDPSVAIRDCNNELCKNNPENMFATMFTAIFDDNSDIVTYVNAGHNTPIIIRNNKAETLSVQSGIALGLFGGVDFTLEQTSFNKGDTLYVYTDGVTDCINERNEFWGEKRLFETLNTPNKPQTTAEYCDSVMTALKQYRATAEPFDDITMICVGTK